jgi:single-strand DNA-binding protein
MFDTHMTVVGNVVAPPRMRMTKGGHSVTNFRVASTPRRYDGDEGKWVDCDTLYVNVTCWRGLAENVAVSLQKGQPVVVTGRYYAREYQVDEVTRVAYELEAVAVGHDLTRGTTEFRKVFRPSGLLHMPPADENGVPADESDHWLGVAADQAESAVVAEAELARELAPAG